MRKFVSMVGIVALILTGCSSKLKVEVTKNLVVEYGDFLDNSKLFDVKKSDEGANVDKVEGFDRKKIGKQELTVTFTDGDKTVDEKITVEVKDTKKPEIVLKKDTVTIIVGDKLEVKDNIKSVKDPVDGEIKYSEKVVEKDGFYIDKSKLDTKKAGTYEVKVIAKDINGNSVEKNFKVKVEKKEVASTKDNNGSSGNSTVPVNGDNGNNGGDKNTTIPPKKKPSTPTKPATKPDKPSYESKWENPDGSCHHRHYPAYNGRWFNTGDEVDAYADDLCWNNGTCGAYGGYECPHCHKICIDSDGFR